MDGYTGYNYGADMNVRMANYKYAEEANSKGIDLAKMSEKMKQYEKEIAEHHQIIDDLKKKVQGSPATAELFSMYEAMVKDIPAVQHARIISDRAKVHALHRVLTAQDSQYKEAYANYEKAVTDAYTELIRTKITVPQVVTEGEKPKAVP